MGFGILFLGYFLTFGSVFFTMYFFLDLIGCAVMIGGLVMLCQYERAFKYPAFATVGLAFVYAASAVMRFMGYSTPAEGELQLIGERIYSIIQTYALPVVTLVFHILLLYAIGKLAKSVDLPSIAKRCKAYVIVFCSYIGVWVIFYLLSERIKASSLRVYYVGASGLTLFNAIWLIMMILLIMSCMKWIAPAEVVEAEARGEEADTGILGRIGNKLDSIQEMANTPKEDKQMLREQREREKERKQRAKEENTSKKDQ